MHSPRQPVRTRGPGPLGRFAAGIVRAVLLGGLVGAVGLVAAVIITALSMPSFETLMRSPQGQSVVIRAADGQELVTVGPSFGEWLAHDRIPPEMIAAMKAVEDRRFDWHPGVDPIGILRSARVNLAAGRRVQGGSTITQQLARNLFLTSSRTFDRKLREIVIALAMERRFTKRAIMELYLNRVYFGGGAYGIDAASRRFFGHPATELSLEEAAIIAGLVKAPSRYAPTADPERARQRAATVLATMADAGAISPAQAAAANLDAVRFRVDPDQGDIRYFTDWVMAGLDSLVREDIQPLEVMTTLVPRHQEAAEAAVKTQQLAGTQAAIVAMRPDGAVTAMVGGRDYRTSNYNRAVTARRQPGSAFKLFTYLAALEDGMTPDDRLVDEPIRIGNWSPRNSDGRFRGTVTMRQAFALSINTVAVRLGQRVGFDTVAAMARRFGISTPIDRRPAMVLGVSETTLLDMTTAYAAVAAGGVEVRPWAIQSVATASGNLLYNRQAPARRVLVAPFVNQRMTDMLRAVVVSGTGRAAQIGRPLAGKTGTTSSNRDGWFIGFTPELVAGVWMGRDDARAVAGLAGGTAPARVFAAFMRPALSGTAPSELDTEVETPGFWLEPDADVYGLSADDRMLLGDLFATEPGTTADPAPAPPPPPPTPGAELAPPASPFAGPPVSPPPPAPLSAQWLDGIIAAQPPAGRDKGRAPAERRPPREPGREKGRDRPQ